jgi:hypothetical protein
MVGRWIRSSGKSVSGSGFEAVVIKMAWLAKADLDLKLPRMFRAE